MSFIPLCPLSRSRADYRPRRLSSGPALQSFALATGENSLASIAIAWMPSLRSGAAGDLPSWGAKKDIALCRPDRASPALVFIFRSGYREQARA